MIRTLTASRLGEKYEEYIDKKLELLECYKKEHYLRMESLRLDIALKKKQLAANIGLGSDLQESVMAPNDDLI